MWHKIVDNRSAGAVAWPGRFNSRVSAYLPLFNKE